MYRHVFAFVAFMLPAVAAAVPENGRIVSLAVMQSQIAECMPDCSAEILQIADLTTRDAFVLDPDNRDILLVGRRERGQISLRFEDLALALQIKGGRFGRRVGSTIYLADAAVSLDPDPKNIEELMAIADELGRASTEAQLQAVLDAWITACQSHHAAMVYGMPRTAVAEAALVIDKAMKAQVSGALPIEAEGYVSLGDLTKRDIKRHRRGEIIDPPALGTLSRFWITPREVVFRSDPEEGAAVIDSFGLQILTEQQILRGGDVVDHGGPGQLQHEWAERTTALIPHLIATDSDWNRVHQFGHLLAIAHMLDAEDAEARSGLSLDWLERNYEVPIVPIPAAFPGEAHVDRFAFTEQTDHGSRKTEVTLPSCGGVDFGISLKRLGGFTSEENKRVRKVRSMGGLMQLYTDF